MMFESAVDPSQNELSFSFMNSYSLSQVNLFKILIILFQVNPNTL